MAMIKLMRHLSQKYFEKFEVHDESQYWETGDENLCRKKFGESEKFLGMIGDALDSMKIDPAESPETIAYRIEKVLSEKFGLKRTN